MLSTCVKYNIYTVNKELQKMFLQRGNVIVGRVSKSTHFKYHTPCLSSEILANMNSLLQK